MSAYLWSDLLSSLPPATLPDAGAGVKVALLDSGVDFNHPALSHLRRAGYCFDATLPSLQVDNQQVRGEDPVYDNTHRQRYHGSNLAGILAGVDATVDAEYHGISPQIELFIFKVSEPSSFISIDAYYRALAYAVYRLNVDIICSAVYPRSGRQTTLSLNDPLLTTVLNDASARNMLFFQALKNVSQPRFLYALSFPASRAATINIGAMSASFHRLARTSPAADFPTRVDYLIPQLDVRICTEDAGGYADQPLTASQATAIMVGTASVLLQEARQSQQDPQLRLSREQLAALLQPACVSVRSDNPFSDRVTFCVPA